MRILPMTCAGAGYWTAKGRNSARSRNLLLDARTGEIRFLQVSAHEWFGIGSTELLIPSGAIADVGDSTVHIQQTRHHVAGAPRYTSESAFTDYLGSVYGYYGYAPYGDEEKERAGG